LSAHSLPAELAVIAHPARGAASLILQSATLPGYVGRGRSRVPDLQEALYRPTRPLAVLLVLRTILNLTSCSID